ncbi:Uncharacterised protein [Halioglobus japonicus]|nr:Uncharacterised protein [Halioglobus japonicus]
MTIIELIEKTVGNRRAVQIFLRIPFLPKRLFLGAKFRYFNRYELDQEAANYIRALVRKPRISIALKLNKIMFSFGPLLEEDKQTLDNIRALRQMLLEWQPKTSGQCYRKICTLIKCFEFTKAKKELQTHGHLLKTHQSKELNKYFDLTEELLAYFGPLTDQAWENSLSYRTDLAETSSKNLVIFYLPPSLLKVDMGIGPFETIFIQISEFIMNFHKSIPRNQYIVEEKLQFSWRNIKEHEGNHEVVSYHTRGNAHGNIRIKESAFPEYLTVDSTGFSGWHSVANLSKSTINEFLESASDDEVEATYQKMYRDLVQSNSSKYKQNQTDANPISTRGEFFFLALQVTSDVVAELAYIDTSNLLKYSSEIAERHQIKLVIKRHPRCTSIKIKELLEALHDSKYVEITDASIHAVLPACKAVITVNSGVGMEALLHLKSIICTGRSEYSYIASTAKSEVELERLMLGFSPTEPRMIKEFLHYYTSEHLFHFDDVSKMHRYWERKSHSKY